ncbi:MAG: TraR/DksA family transcriptional regulator [Candidatus Methylomirabilia bacterium]
MGRIEEKVLVRVRMRLQEEQLGRLRKADALGRRRTGDGTPEPVVGDEADLALVSIEEQLEHLELRRISSSVRAIEAALLTLERGCYGVCLRCDKTIPSSRLQALPTAILCRGCQEAAEESLAGCRA